MSGPAGVGKKGTESSSYRDYVLREWEHFHNDPAASRATAEALGGAPARSVLDVGCGAGQELLLFAKRDSFTVGIDVSPEVGTFALGPEYDRLTFVRASGERIPFTSASFDIVICRIALPYMNNAQALAEIARVLVPGGLLVLQVHAMWYYVEKLGKGFLDRDAQGMRYAWRVLANGIRYNLTGTQRRYPVRGETFQTKWMLKRELRRVGLEVVRELPRLKHAAPGFLIRKAR